MNTFTIDSQDLKKLDRFFKGFPKEMRQATAGILNSLAFQTRKNDIQIISANMIIRNRRFLESSLRVKTTPPRRIEEQVAYAYSMERPRFTGWKEQQKGTPPKRKRSITKYARGGDMHKQVRHKARLKSGNKFYRPEQYQGKTYQQRFYFMMRVLGSRGGGEFLLLKKIATKRGMLGRGLYVLKGHQIKKLQDFERSFNVRRDMWRSQSLSKLHSNNDIQRIWKEQLNRIINKHK